MDFDGRKRESYRKREVESSQPKKLEEEERHRQTIKKEVARIGGLRKKARGGEQEETPTGGS